MDMGDIRDISRKEIVHTDYFKTLLKEMITKMRTEETGSTSD
jgi:hypothetical protein